MKKILFLASTAFACLLFCSDRAVAEDGGYLFVTFRHEGPTGEQVYFALSKDGRNWTCLPPSKGLPRPVLVNNLGDKGARDPFILRLHGGNKYVILATDLSICERKASGKNGAEAWKDSTTSGSRSLVVWESGNLVDWDGPRLVAVAPEDAGCAWAPEAVYDSEQGDYLVFWASTSSADNFKKQRILACRTKDFQTFSKPEVYIESPDSIIDTTIIHDGKMYYRFSKNASKAEIFMESSAKLSGPWEEVSNFSLANTPGCEGPACYPLNAEPNGTSKTWCLIADFYMAGTGYKPFITNELSSGKFDEAQGFTFPFKFRHGSILPLTKEEYIALEDGFPENGKKKSAIKE